MYRFGMMGLLGLALLAVTGIARRRGRDAGEVRAATPGRLTRQAQTGPPRALSPANLFMLFQRHAGAATHCCGSPGPVHSAGRDR